MLEKSKSSYLSLSYFCFCVFVSIFVVVGRAFEDTVVSCKGCYYGAATATGSAAPKPRPALKSTLVKKPSCQYQKWDSRTALSFHMNALFIHYVPTCQKVRQKVSRFWLRLHSNLCTTALEIGTICPPWILEYIFSSCFPSKLLCPC